MPQHQVLPWYFPCYHQQLARLEAVLKWPTAHSLDAWWIETGTMCCRAWNAETAITGGLVGDDLLTIMWNKIAALTGGSQEWPIGLGLRPWYLKVPFRKRIPAQQRMGALQLCGPVSTAA